MVAWVSVFAFDSICGVESWVVVLHDRCEVHWLNSRLFYLCTFVDARFHESLTSYDQRCDLQR